MSKLVNISALAFVSLLSILATGSGCNKKADVPAAATPVAGAAKPFAVGDKAHCPVTGEEFTVAASTVQVEQDGKHYAFCCADCQPAFTKNPGKYTKKN